MGIAERKSREKEEIKALILSSAKKLFVNRGVEQTTIRSIAQSIDYSVGTVYVYFRDKNAILNELHTQGFKQLADQFKVLEHVQDPMERLMAMGGLYVKFALENPDMYELMFSLKAPMEFLDDNEQEEWDEGKTAFTALKTTVEQCISKKHFKGRQLEPLTFMIWSAVHGMCSLHISQRTKGVRLQNADNIVTEGLEEFLAILRKL